MQGQNIDDAISLTFENNNGNARFSSMSGAFSSWVETCQQFQLIRHLVVFLNCQDWIFPKW